MTVACVALLVSLPVRGAETTLAVSAQNTITPSHAYQRVVRILGELELIRLEMGRGQVESSPLRVENAAPREVYFQAITLFRKSDRLAFEHTREGSEPPAPPPGEIRPSHVRHVLDAALGRIQRLKEILGITEEVEEPPLLEGIQPSQVFIQILNANRQLNRLLEKQFSPGDVFRQVTVAVAYATRLLDAPGQVSSPPPTPPLERRKRPADVYRRLLACYELVRQAGQISRVQMLLLDIPDPEIDKVEPSDVYDVASLLVSELAFMHGLIPGAKPPRKAYNPGRRLPAHVYQRAGILEEQLRVLIKRAKQNPDWLSGHEGNLTR
jgi:hypothetical protein